MICNLISNLPCLLSILAENISTCVYFISDLRIANICSQYVLSISLSASSITSVLTSCTRSFFWRINCKIRAGVPTTSEGFVLSDSIWRLIFPRQSEIMPYMAAVRLWRAILLHYIPELQAPGSEQVSTSVYICCPAASLQSQAVNKPVSFPNLCWNNR